jgi:hypothetical protein
MKEYELRKIEEAIEDILRSTRRPSVFGHNISAFDEGYKIFVFPDRNSLSIEAAYMVQEKLSEMNIKSEIVIDGAQSASYATLCFLVWKE